MKLLRLSCANCRIFDLLYGSEEAEDCAAAAEPLGSFPAAGSARALSRSFKSFQHCCAARLRRVAKGKMFAVGCGSSGGGKETAREGFFCSSSMEAAR